MANIRIVCHRHSTDAFHLAQYVSVWLETQGHNVYPAPSIFESYSQTYLNWMMSVASETGDAPDYTAVLAIGGDGTFLEAAHIAWSHDIPVFGINLGKRGYLAEVLKEDWNNALNAFLGGDFTIEPRRGLCGALSNGTDIDFALNDIVLEKTNPGRTITIGVTINDRFFKDITADGIIISSATGSTGYSLSAGGPPAAPQTNVMLVTPVAPTSKSLGGSIIIDGTEGSVVLELKGHEHGAVAYDGILVEKDFQVGDLIAISGQTPLQFVQFGDTKFHQTLVEKFEL